MKWILLVFRRMRLPSALLGPGGGGFDISADPFLQRDELAKLVTHPL